MQNSDILLIFHAHIFGQKSLAPQSWLSSYAYGIKYRQQNCFYCSGISQALKSLKFPELSSIRVLHKVVAWVLDYQIAR